MDFMLGKTPARLGAVSLKFATFFSAPDLPTPPLVFGRPGHVPAQKDSPWGMLANDSVGCCVWSDAGHQTMYWRALAGRPVSFDDNGVLSDYSASTGYIRGNSSTDHGTDLQQAAAYRQKIGVVDASGVRHKTDAYVALEVGNIDQIALATWKLWTVSLGIQFPSSARDQFDRGEVWTPVSGSSIEGGHCVSIIGRNSRGEFLIVTWGQLTAVTPAFISAYMDEGICHLSFDQMKSDDISPRGFDENALRAALAQL
jgi:hypothetical protein